MPQEKVIYPFPDTLKKEARDMTKGNFGLWYNKFIPVNPVKEDKDDKKDAFKACDVSGKVTDVVKFYQECYKQMIQNEAGNTLKKLLERKHLDQSAYCGSFPVNDYEVITSRATLKTPLITGIGESHPHEVSMVFDHNLGIPYIPASGVKGIVRFAHAIALWESGVPQEYLKTDEKKGLEYIDDESYEAIYGIFGNQKNRGQVVFLDAYPEKVPDLHIDIMNPHYGDYYDPKSGHRLRIIYR